MAEKDYQRLTRTAGRNFLGITRASLWLGSDHLLCVETTGYSEIYKRFYFRDVEVIVVRGNNARNIWTMVWSVAVFLFFVFGLVADETAAKVVYLCLAGVAAVALVINLVLGPTCKCEIRTLVQTEPLPLSRVRAVRKFLDRVRPLIASAQGQLTPEEVTARLSERASVASVAPAPAVVAPAAAAVTSETPDAAPASSPSPNEDGAHPGTARIEPTENIQQ